MKPMDVQLNGNESNKNNRKYFLKYFYREYIIKTIICIIGVFIIGIGVGIMRYVDLGLDPFMCLSNGIYLTVSKPLNISFGTSFLLFTFVLVIAVFIFDRSEIGLGTVLAMSLTGYISDFGLFFCNLLLAEMTKYFIFRIFMMFFGIILISIGSGIYFNTHIGISPYDAAGIAITAKIGNEKMYRFVRIGTDIICVIGGFLMGNKPGIGTIVMAFFTGPLFNFFRNKFFVWGKNLKIIT
jgi:uncharacterized membrane protein YczE